MCFRFSPRKSQHINKFDPHQFPGQFRKLFILIGFFSPDILGLSGTGDSHSRESFAIETPIFIARQADSPESPEFLIRANHAT